MEEQGFRVYLVVLAVLLILLAISPIILFLPRDTARQILQENGPLENASAMGYAAGAAISWFLAKKKGWNRGYIGGFILFLCALRELDFHVRFTTKGVFKLNFYTSSAVSLAEKLMVIGILLIILLPIFWFILNNWRRFANALKERKPHAISAFSAIPLLMIAKVVDRTPSLIKHHLGVQLDPNMDIICLFLEETLELVVPILFLIALFQWIKWTDGHKRLI